MALQTSVLLYQVTTLHEARYGAGMGVALIGLPVAENNPLAISPTAFSEIKGWLEGVELLAQVNNLPITENLAADGWLVTDMELAKHLTATQKPVYMQLEASSEEALQGLLPTFNSLVGTVEAFLLSFQGELTPAACGQLKIMTQQYPLLVNAAFSPDQLPKFIEHVAPLGIALTGAKEIKTGLNDFDALADLLEAIDTDEFA